MSKHEKAQLPDPNSSPELFENLLMRRVAAFFIDTFVLTLIVSVISIIGLVMGLFTFGVSWLALLVVLPLSIVAYYGATLGSEKRATIGMSVMDLVLTPARGGPMNGWAAFAHPLVFWITSWILPPFSLMVALFTPRRQMIHDYIMGTLMVRRSPMEQHWNRHAA